MLSIRLSRVGRKNAPTFRLVVMPKTRDPWAKVTEILGHYNPRTQPKALTIDAERVSYWLANGAQPTDSVWNLLVQEGIVKGEKRSVTHLSGKRRGKIEEKSAAEAEAKAKAAEAAKAKAEAEAAEKAAAEEAAKAAAEAPAEAAPAPEEAPAEEAAPAEPAEEAPKAE